MMVSQRVMSITLGANVLAWGVLGLATSPIADRWSVVRIAISLLHLVVGTLLITRAQVVRHGEPRELMMALPSIVASGLAFKFSPDPGSWPGYAQVVFAVATFFAAVSLACLGRNFAVLPALRSVTSIGPYVWIRHPAYAAEAVMALACWLAGPNWVGGVAIILLVPFLLARILAEERVLAESPEYQQYARSVPWRLVRGVW